MKKISSRSVAAQVLYTFFVSKKEDAGQQTFAALFDYTINKAALGVNDRALAMEIAYGVLRHRQQLDELLLSLSKTPLKKLNPFLHKILVVGLYQIFFLDRIPDSAAVNEAVESCKSSRSPYPHIAKHLQGFANGVLRQAVRDKAALRQKINSTVAANFIPNHPNWLLNRWVTTFGEEKTRNICTINNSQPSLTLRANTCRITREKLCEQLCNLGYPCHYGIAPDAVILESPCNVSKLPGYKEGVFQVQGESAQLASLLLAPINQDKKSLGENKKRTILDGCAGVGGKTSHLIQLDPQSTIYAVEPHKERFALLQENIERLFGVGFKDIPNVAQQVHLYNCDLLDFAQRKFPKFDAILLDVPCSGTGVIRRRPDIRWRRSVEDIERYKEMQSSLLDAATQFLTDGGIIVYATCSIETEENDEVIAQFLEKNAHFRLEGPKPFLPFEAHPFIRNNFFAPLPQEDTDGFFAARLQCMKNAEIS